MLPNFVGSERRRRPARSAATEDAPSREDRAGPSGDCAATDDPSRASRSRRRHARQRSWSGTAHERRAGERVAPRTIDGARDSDAGRGDDLDRPGGPWRASKGGDVRSAPSCAPVSPSAWVSRPGPAASRHGSSTPRRARISSSPCRGLEGAKENGSADALGPADDVRAPVHAVRAIDVETAGRTEHRRVTLRSRPPNEWLAGSSGRVRLGLDDRCRPRRRRGTSSRPVRAPQLGRPARRTPRDRQNSGSASAGFAVAARSLRARRPRSPRSTRPSSAAAARRSARSRAPSRSAVSPASCPMS